MDEREKKIEIIMKQHPDMDRETAASILDQNEMLMHYAMMSNEERCNIIDSGCFNSIITGYGILLLEHLDLSDKVKKGEVSRVMSEIFDFIPAETAQKKYNAD